MAGRSGPSLSICVPTHHGRASTLDELLERLGREPGADGVEVCVSDNASHDGTGDVIERHRSRFGDRLRYGRHDRNLGMPGNVVAVIEMASSDYCWLIGSDDAPAPGSLERVRELLARYDGVGGIVVGHMRVSATDLDQPGWVVVPEPYPPQRKLTRFEGRREVVESLGYTMYFTSDQVINRRLWRAVADAEREQVRRARSAPHLYVIGRMVERVPDWVWCPEPLALSREAPVYLADSEGLSFAATMRRMLSDLEHAWSALYGRRSYEYRALMHKALRHVWDAENVIGVRIQSPGSREYLANLWCARRFWWSRWFWRSCLPRLVMPAGPLRDGSRRGRTAALDPVEVRVRVTGVLPAEMTVGYGTRVWLRLENRGAHALSSAAPYPVRLAVRWENAETGLGVAVLAAGAALWPPLRPGHSRDLELLIAPPPRPGTYRVCASVHQMRVGWLDTAHADNGLPGITRVEPVVAA